jgi:hypothetical protein
VPTRHYIYLPNLPVYCFTKLLAAASSASRHPDKHPDNQEEAKAKFQVIQKAYDMLMSTDEEEIQMQLT